MKSKVLTFDESTFTYIIRYKEVAYTCYLDPEDFYKFKEFNWYYRCGYVGRARRVSDPIGSCWVHLHHEVIGIEVPEGMVVDHINRNKMDNRKCNLRIVSFSDNMLNVSDQSRENRKKSAHKATETAAKLPRTSTQLNTSSENARKMNFSGSNVHKGSDNVSSKKIINTETGEVFACIREAADSCGIKYSTLKSRINGSSPTPTTFKYFMP